MRLSFLAPVYRSHGPYASVLLDTTRATEKAPHEIELRWRDLRDRLARSGVDDRTLEALEGAVGEDKGLPGQRGQALFAAEGGLRLRRDLPAPPSRDIASYEPVPDPLPLLVTMQHVVPHVVAVVDRTGADVYAYGPHGGVAEAETVEGARDKRMQKVHGGDDANKHYQRRAENIWSENAEKVAEEVGTLVHELHADLLVVAGDPHAREMLESHLDPHSREVLTPVEEGARAEGASNEKLQQQVRELVKEAAHRRRQEALDAFERERGRGEAAAEGISGAVSAFQRGQVHTLFLPEEASFLPQHDLKPPPGSAGDAATPEAPHGASPTPQGGDVELWIGRDPARIAASEQELATLGSDDARSAPALPALVRAAYGTEAEVVLLPADVAESLTDGVGCLLRWSDSAEEAPV